MTKPARFVHITRAIDSKTGVHYLDAIDDEGRHWQAQMSHRLESWICYTETWRLYPQQLR